MLAVLPLVYLVAVVVRYRLDFPFLDQWEFVPLLEKMYVGQVTFGDLWAQHNEHRLIFPRLVMLGLARYSDWNIGWELVTNVVLGTGLFAALAWQVKRTEKATDKLRVTVLMPLLSLLVFSMGQWENWTLGWQLQEWMNVLAVVTGFVLLGHADTGRTSLAMSLLLGVVATYSFANGMLYWPVGLVVLGMVHGTAWRARWGRFAAWIAVSVLVVASYLYDYHTPPYHPSVWLVFQHPVAYSLYVLKFLGNPLANFSEMGAALAGFVGLAVLCAATWRLVRAGTVRVPVLAPYAGFALYAMGSAMITGVGRVGFGSSQAMSPRYITLANLLWVAVFVLVALWLRERSSDRMTARVLACGTALLLAFCSLYGTYRWTERYNYRIAVRETLLHGDDMEMLRRIHPEPEKISARRDVLRRLGLSIFRDAEQEVGNEG